MTRATKRITIDEVNPLLVKNDFKNPLRKLRVCAYARVSSDDEDQITSYNNQVCYYTDYIPVSYTHLDVYKRQDLYYID